MSNLIKEWFNKVKPYLFTYKKGFFVLPYVSSTPQLMWKSLQKMPFIRFSPTLNMSESNTPFLNAKMFYEEVNNNLVIFYNEIKYKKNVTFDHYQDDDIPLEYYCLTGSLSKNEEGKFKTIVCDMHFNGQLWILHKPDAPISHFHFKDSIDQSIILYFKKEWLLNYMQLFPDGNEKLIYFLESENQSLGRTFENNEIGLNILNEGTTLMRKNVSPERTEQLQEYVSKILEFFKSDCLEFIKSENYININTVDLLKIIKTEQIINDSYLQEFPGISFLAKKVGLSETKFKTNFKSVYNVSPYQYFRNKQMDKAKELLEQNPELIKNIALQLGYENASKFSAAYKNRHGILPSEEKAAKISAIKG